MTSQMKQRVVGVCVLVFLALIVLPWLFGTNQPAAFEEKNKKESLASAEMPEVVSRIEPSEKPIPETPKQIDPASVTEKFTPTQEISPASPLEQKSSHSLNPEKIAKIQNNIVHAESDILTHDSNDTKFELNKKIDKKIVSPTEKIQLKKPSLTKIKVSTTDINKNLAKTSEKNWTVQLGSFSNKENAQKLFKQLKAKGFSAYVKTSKDSSGNPIMRVFVGPEADRRIAESNITKIEKSFKVHGVIVKSNL